MKKYLIIYLIIIFLFKSSISYATGSWNIEVAQVEDGSFVAMLKSTYSDYYNESVTGNFLTFGEAEDAAEQALLSLHTSGVHADPANCFFVSDLM
ncbi:MAG: hypothetical protein V3U76_20845 [Granulosicoccus sp.]